MEPKFPSLKAWRAASQRHAVRDALPRDLAMEEAARRARIDAAKESAERDAEMLALHVGKALEESIT